MEKTGYISALEDKLLDLQKKIASKRSGVQDIFAEISQLQKQADHIHELLKVEGVELAGEALREIRQTSIADIAYEYLSKQKDQSGIHYQDLAENIMSQGVPIPGKNPSANLLAHIGRDKRFIRVGAGTYGLAQWGVTEVASKRKSKTRRRKKK